MQRNILISMGGFLELFYPFYSIVLGGKFLHVLKLFWQDVKDNKEKLIVSYKYAFGYTHALEKLIFWVHAKCNPSKGGA